MSDFKGVTEKFSVELVSEEGYGSERVRMAELLQSQEQNSRNTEVANSLNQLIRGETKRPQLKALEDVEFWRDPEKTGWMQCQGEVIKSWRRRWFILKEGFLFRFSSPDVNAASKPRGFVDLSKVTDVSEARDQTGKNNSLKLSTETGHVAYLADSETELVEWISALEGAVSAIVRKVAGLEQELAPAPKQTSTTEWTKQLEKVYSSAGSGSRPQDQGRKSDYGFKSDYGRGSDYDRNSDYGRTSSYGGGPRRESSYGGRIDDGRDRNQMVKIVGYETPASQPRNDYRDSQRQSNYGGGLSVNDISGIAGVAQESHQNTGPFSDSFSRSQDYPAYPVLAPSGTANYGPTANSPNQNYGGHYGESTNSSNYSSAYQQAPPPPPQVANSWQVHYTAEGRPYYHDPSTGVTQWEVPAGTA